MSVFVYALYNREHKKIYVGQTEDLEERLLAHKEKRFKNSYTSRFDGNWELIYQEEVSTRTGALRREKQLKSYQGRQFIKQHFPL